MRLFAYGADMGSAAVEGLLGRRVVARRALLRGFRLAFTTMSEDWEGGIADIVKDEEAEVEGVVFDLSPEDELRLGFAEGLEGGPYRRRRVPVELEDGEEGEAVAREVASKRPHIPPSPTYLDAMVSAATERGLSEGYIDFLLQLYPDEPTPLARAWSEDE